MSTEWPMNNCQSSIRIISIGFFLISVRGNMFYMNFIDKPMKRWPQIATDDVASDARTVATSNVVPPCSCHAHWRLLLLLLSWSLWLNEASDLTERGPTPRDDPPSMEGTDMDVDAELMQKFSCMGTTDKDVLISEFQRLLGFQLNPAGCAFFLDMTNWWVRG